MILKPDMKYSPIRRVEIGHVINNKSENLPLIVAEKSLSKATHPILSRRGSPKLQGGPAFESRLVLK